MIAKRISGGGSTGLRLSRLLNGSEATNAEMPSRPPDAVGQTSCDTSQEEYSLFEEGGLPRGTAAKKKGGPSGGGPRFMEDLAEAAPLKWNNSQVKVSLCVLEEEWEPGSRRVPQ